VPRRPAAGQAAGGTRAGRLPPACAPSAPGGTGPPAPGEFPAPGAWRRAPGVSAAAARCDDRLSAC